MENIKNHLTFLTRRYNKMNNSNLIRLSFVKNRKNKINFFNYGANWLKN